MVRKNTLFAKKNYKNEDLRRTMARKKDIFLETKKFTKAIPHGKQFLRNGQETSNCMDNNRFFFENNLFFYFFGNKKTKI